MFSIIDGSTTRVFLTCVGTELCGRLRARLRALRSPVPLGVRFSELVPQLVALRGRVAADRTVVLGRKVFDAPLDHGFVAGLDPLVFAEVRDGRGRRDLGAGFWCCHGGHARFHIWGVFVGDLDGHFTLPFAVIIGFCRAIPQRISGAFCQCLVPVSSMHCSGGASLWFTLLYRCSRQQPGDCGLGGQKFDDAHSRLGGQ